MSVLLARVHIGDHGSHRLGLISTFVDCYERGRYVPGIFRVRVAPAHDKPRSGLNNSERESTSSRSTDYGSGHLTRVFRDIGRMFSLLFLLSHPSPVGHLQRGRVQKPKPKYGFVRAKNGFNCVSCGTHRGGMYQTPSYYFAIRTAPKPNQTTKSLHYRDRWQVLKSGSHTEDNLKGDATRILAWMAAVPV
jgi:hypothetical protein